MSKSNEQISRLPIPTMLKRTFSYSDFQRKTIFESNGRIMFDEAIGRQRIGQESAANILKVLASKLVCKKEYWNKTLFQQFLRVEQSPNPMFELPVLANGLSSHLTLTLPEQAATSQAVKRNILTLI